MLKSQLSVQDSEHSECQACQQSPEDTHKSRIIKIVARNDQKNSHEAEQGEKNVHFDDFFPEKERFKKGCEYRVAGKGQKADCDCGYLNRLKERHPMDGKDESEEYKVAGVSSLRDFQALFGKPQDES